MENVLEEILGLGERVLSALASNDLDAFYALLDRRDASIERLTKAAAAGKITQIDAKDAQSLEAQYHLIVAALDKTERAMMQQLQNLDQFKKAGQTYRSARQRPQFIKRRLLG